MSQCTLCICDSADCLLLYSFGPHKLAQALDTFLSVKKATQQIVGDLHLTPLPTMNIPSPPSPLLTPTHSNTEGKDLIANQESFTPSPTRSPVMLPVHTNRIQDPILPPHGQVLLVEDNEINLKVQAHTSQSHDILLYALTNC